MLQEGADAAHLGQGEPKTLQGRRAPSARHGEDEDEEDEVKQQLLTSEILVVFASCF